MKLFGVLHLSLLAVIALITIVLAVCCRRGVITQRATRLAVGGALAINELIWWVFRYSREGIHTANLPLQLCDVSVWLSVIACFTLSPLVVEFAYFAGLAGAGMALLTPDLFSPWPTYPAIYFFLAHGGIVLAVCLLAFGGFTQFRPGAVWRAFGLLLVYGAIVGVVNYALGSNYMYLQSKPHNASLFDQMGPWPWYLAVAAALGLALFWLLWLPVRPRHFSYGGSPDPRRTAGPAI